MQRLLLFLLLCSVGLSAQTGRWDLRAGSGTYFTGSLDMRGLMIENEINYTVARKIAVSGQLGFGRSDAGVGQSSTFLQTNATLFWSPFGNDQNNDFRLGAGGGVYSVSDSYQSSAQYLGDQLIDADYRFDQRTSAGFNLAMENTYAVTQRFLVGAKLFVQNYGGDLNHGALLKVGFRL